MMVYKRLLIATSFGLLLPAVSFADVFSCPSLTKITMIKNTHKDRTFDTKWEARLEELPHGMPTLFKGARFTSDGVFGRNNDLIDSDMPLEIYFTDASYNKGSNFAYECSYEAKGYNGLVVTLNLSENYLPGSNKMPLLIEPYGANWQTVDAEGSLPKCAGSAEQCSFHLPQYAVRVKTEAPAPSGKPAPTAFSLKLDRGEHMEGQVKHSQSNVLINATNTTEYLTFGDSHLKASNLTSIKLYDQKTPVNIYDFIKARGGEPETPVEGECAVDSGVTVKCSCSSDNLMLSLNSNGHTMVDLFAAYDEDYAVSKARCHLFNVPASTDQHDQHDHQHDEH